MQKDAVELHHSWILGFAHENRTSSWLPSSTLKPIWDPYCCVWWYKVQCGPSQARNWHMNNGTHQNSPNIITFIWEKVSKICTGACQVSSIVFCPLIPIIIGQFDFVGPLWSQFRMYTWSYSEKEWVRCYLTSPILRCGSAQAKRVIFILLYGECCHLLWGLLELKCIFKSGCTMVEWLRLFRGFWKRSSNKSLVFVSDILFYFL